ncbi:hypothetical protein F5B20DRAFT_345354 [Whalleya microplaca]|nr:hypothetical protein F5B20DRAFT_345354 [Whalleya microplaca]
MKTFLGLMFFHAASIAIAQSAPETIPTILAIRGANSGGCFPAPSLDISLKPNNLRLDFSDMRAAVSPTDEYDTEAAICVMIIELGAFPQGWRFGLSDVTYTGHAKLSGGARMQNFAVNAYFQWEHLKNSLLIEQPTVKNTSGSYLMDVPTTPVDFGLNGDYDEDFQVNIPNNNLAWSPCFTGQEYSYDDKMEVQFQFHAYLTKEGYSTTGNGVFGRIKGPALTAEFGLVWDKCDPLERNAWGHFRIDDFETCQRGSQTDSTTGKRTVQW